MSTSPIGSNSLLLNSLSQSPSQQLAQDFQQLAQAVQSGNLSSAQSLFNSITQNTSNNSSPLATALNNPDSQIGQDFAALGKAIQSGDTSGAQQDFQKLQGDIKSQFANSTGQLKGHHHHHHHGGGDSSTGSTTDTSNSTTPSDSSTSSSIGSTINLTA